MNTAQSRSLAQARILVVDDDAMLRRLIRSRLEKQGYVVIEAGGGEEGIQLFESEHPDIVLMDASMPGMDGFEATQAIHRGSPNRKVPVIMVSGLEDDDSVDQAFTAGAVEYITKPICWPLLIHRLAKICEAMEAESTIVQAKLAADMANQAKSEFLANMSHELRTPMHAILNYAELGVERVEDADPQILERYFSRVFDSGQRLLSLLNNLLDLSKLEAGIVELHFSNNDLRYLVDTVVDEISGLISKKNLQVEFDAPRDTYFAEVDQDKMMQVFRNLLANAVKFSPDGGVIRLELRRYQEDSREYLQFGIQDQGMGIPEEELDLVFGNFVQSSSTKTGAGGTGLGLAICKDIIRRHQGRIWAQNCKDAGVRFLFLVPLKAQDSKQRG